MDEHHVGALLLEDRLDVEQHAARHVEKRLTGLHDGEVVVRDDPERPEHLVEHLPMLPRDADLRVELFGAALQHVGEGAHLDGLGTRAEDEHDLLFGLA